MATGFEDLGAIEEPKSQPHGFEDLGAVAEKAPAAPTAPAPAAQDDSAAFADLGAVTPQVRARQLVADPDFNPAAYAHETGDEDTAFEARELRRNRSFGEKAGEFGKTLLKPETYVSAARSAGAFAGGLVATPLHAIAQAGATAGAPIARAVGADNLANTLENEQQTQGSEALQSAQQIEESLRSLGRGARGLVSGDERARFRDEIAAYRNQLALGQQRPLDTGVVAAASRALTGNDPSAAFSPEALAAQGARPASPLMIELGAASGDPTNMMIPVAGKVLPKVLAGGVTQAAGKVMQAPAATIAYIPKVAHLNKVMKTGSVIGAGVAAYEAVQHPEQAAQIAGVIALGKTLGWLGRGLDAQGRAYRTGTPSPLDIAKAAGRGTFAGNTQRLIGNTAVNAALGVAALEPVDYLQAEGDPRLMAEALIGNAGMGAMFGLPGETFANRQQMQAIQAYRFAQHGAQQLSQNAAYPAHNAVMATMKPEYRDQINRLRAYLHAGTGTDVLVLDSQSYAQIVGQIGGDTRGVFHPTDGAIYINADAVSNASARGMKGTVGHEGGHAIVAFLQNAGREGEANGLFEAIKAGMSKEQLQTLTSSYRGALSKGTKGNAQAGLGWATPETNRAEIDARIAEQNPEVKILEENLSEIVRSILDGRAIEGFTLSKPILERLTDTVAGWMESIGWLNPIDTKAELGFKAQMVREAARQAKTLLYETGQRASAAMADGPTAEQEMIRIQREIDAVPPFNPQGVAATEQANAQQRQRLQRELSQWERRGAGIPVPEDAAPPAPDGTPAPVPAADPITTAAEQLRAEGNRTPYPAVRQAMQRNPAAITAEQIVETVKALAQEKITVKQATDILTGDAWKYTPTEAKQHIESVIAQHGDPVTDTQKLVKAASRVKAGGKVERGEFNRPDKPEVRTGVKFNDHQGQTRTVTGSEDRPAQPGDFIETRQGVRRVVGPSPDGRGVETVGPFIADETRTVPVLHGQYAVLTTTAAPKAATPPSPAQESKPPNPAPAQAATPAPAAGEPSPQQSQETPPGTPQGTPAAIPGLDAAPGAGTPEPPAPKPKGAPIPLAKGPGGVDDILNLIAKMGGMVSRKGTQEFDDMSKRLAGYPIMGGTETPEDLANHLHTQHNIGDGSVVEMWKAIDAAIVARKSNRQQVAEQDARNKAAENAGKSAWEQLPQSIQDKLADDPSGDTLTTAEKQAVNAAIPGTFKITPQEAAKARIDATNAPAPEPPPSQPVPPRTGVTTAEPPVPDGAPRPGEISHAGYQEIAALAREEYLSDKTPAKTGPNRGQHTKENQKAADRAAFQAAAEAHAATVPANYEGIKLTESPLGEPEVSGTIRPGRAFDDYLLGIAGTTPEQLQTILDVQNRIGDTISLEYAHAAGRPGEPNYRMTRRVAQKNDPAKGRIQRGNAQTETKVFLPQKMKFNFGTKTITTLGTNSEKLLANFGWAAEAMEAAGETMPYRSVSDPKLVADLKGLQANHDAGYTWDGQPITGIADRPLATNRPSGEGTPYQGFMDEDGMPDLQRFEFLNMLLGNEGARIGKRGETAIQKAKMTLGVQNRGDVSDPVTAEGETNQLRDRLNEAMGPQELLDADGNPTGKTDRWSATFLEDPLNEALLVDNIERINPTVERGESPLHESGYRGDLDRHLGKLKTVNTEQERIAAAGRFMPEDASTAGAEGKTKARAAQLWKEKGTESPFFKKWFGESKVVDDRGKPQPAYHGTTKAGFTEFDPNRQMRDSGWYGRGSYFTLRPSEANGYTADYAGRVPQTAGVYKVFLKIENPLRVENRNDMANQIQKLGGNPNLEGKELSAEIQRLGFDGVITNDGGEAVIFDPKQVKSATGNQGTFDPSNPDIRFLPEDPRDQARARIEDRRRAENELRRRLGSAYGNLTPQEREQEMQALTRRPSRGARFMPEEGIGGYADPLFDIPQEAQEKIYDQTEEALRTNYRSLHESYRDGTGDKEEYRRVFQGIQSDLSNRWARENPRTAPAGDRRGVLSEGYIVRQIDAEEARDLDGHQGQWWLFNDGDEVVLVGDKEMSKQDAINAAIEQAKEIGAKDVGTFDEATPQTVSEIHAAIGRLGERAVSEDRDYTPAEQAESDRLYALLNALPTRRAGTKARRLSDAAVGETARREQSNPAPGELPNRVGNYRIEERPGHGWMVVDRDSNSLSLHTRREDAVTNAGTYQQLFDAGWTDARIRDAASSGDSNLARATSPQQPMTVREMRTALFNMPTEAASVLRQRLFEMRNQDEQAPAWAVSTFAEISARPPQTAEAGRGLQGLEHERLTMNDIETEYVRNGLYRAFYRGNMVAEAQGQGEAQRRGRDNAERWLRDMTPEERRRAMAPGTGRQAATPRYDVRRGTGTSWNVYDTRAREVVDTYATEQSARIGATRMEQEARQEAQQPRTSMPRLPQPRGTLSDNSPLASLHTDLDGKIVEQQKGIEDEIKALTEQIDEYGETAASDVEVRAQRAELEEFRRSLVEDHAGLNSLRESLRLANPTTLTEYPRAFAEIRRLEVRGLISHEAKERAYDALSDRQNTEIARQIIAEEEARPERERRGRIDAKIRAGQREAQQARMQAQSVWDDLLQAKDAKNLPKVAKLWQQVSRSDEAFAYGRTKATDPAQIAKDMSTPGHEITGTAPDSGSFVQFRSPNGAISISDANGRPEISAPGAGSRGKKEGGGSQLYQAAFAWAHNNGKVIHPSNALSAINAYVRRTSNMLSSALRFGTTRHMIPDNAQGVKNWKKEGDGIPDNMAGYGVFKHSKNDAWFIAKDASLKGFESGPWRSEEEARRVLEQKRRGEFEYGKKITQEEADTHNIAQLAMRESEQVLKAVPALQRVDFDFKTGKMRADGKDITPADLGKMLETAGKANTYEKGIGLSTAQRAIITASAIREADGGQLARADRGRGVRVLKEQQRLLYMPSEHSDAIKESAVKMKGSGKIYTGGWHGEAIEKAIKEEGIDPLNGDASHIAGYTTKTGRFLDRKEAYAHSKKIGQITDPDYHKGNTEKSLESGDFLLLSNFMPEDTGQPGESRRREENLAREAEQAGVNLSLETIKRLTRGDQVAMNAVRRRIEEQTGKAARFMPEDAENARDIVPAIRINGTLTKGQKGDTHQDILNRHMDANPDDVDALMDFDSKTNPNLFVGPDGQEIGREQLKERFGVRDSQGLRRIQEGQSFMPEDEPQTPQARARARQKARKTGMSSNPNVNDLLASTNLSESDVVHMRKMEAQVARTRDSAWENPDERIIAAALRDPTSRKVFTGATHGYANPRDRKQLDLGKAKDPQEHIGYLTNTGRWVGQDEAAKKWGIQGSETSAAYWADPATKDAALGRGNEDDRYVNPMTEAEYQAELYTRTKAEQERYRKHLAKPNSREAAATRQLERQHSVQIGDARMTDGPQEIRMPRFLPEELHHGTPHEVDKFSTAKIGTGEGAQVYGWGLYLAEKKEVAQAYARPYEHTGERDVMLDGKRIAFGNTSESAGKIDAIGKGALLALSTVAGIGKEKTEESLKRQIKEFRGNDFQERFKEALAWFKANKGKITEKRKGNLYTVRVKPDADAFLDWDKPLSEQSEKVKAAIETLRKFIPPILKGEVRTAGDIYNHADMPAKQKSEKLASLGIAGIRYKDQGSRASVQQRGSTWTVNTGIGDHGSFGTREAAQKYADSLPQTSNYVIFDENDIEITHRNGEPVTPAERREAMGKQKFMPEEDEKPDFTKDGYWNGVRYFVHAFGPKTIFVNGIKADRPGAGLKFLRDMTKWADKNGVTISGDARPMRANEGVEPMPKDKLLRLYKMFGFTSRDGDSVYRAPREATQNPAPGKSFMPEEPNGLSDEAREVWNTAKAKPDEFSGVDATHLSAADRKALAIGGLSFTINREHRAIATYPQRLRAADLREKVMERQRQRQATNPAPGEQRFIPETGEIFVKSATKREADSQRWPKPTRKGYEVVHRRTGEQGEGFYERPIPTGAVDAKKFFMPEDEPSVTSLRDEFKRTSLISTGTARKILGDKPDYLDAVADFMGKQRQKTVNGALTKRDVAKAYLLTLGSIGAGGISPETFTAKTGMKIPKRYLSIEGGNRRIRPEEAVALWMGTPDGKAALDAIDAGNATPEHLDGLLKIRDAFGRNDIRNNALRVGGNQRTLANIAEVTNEINAAKGDVDKIGAALQSLTGIAGGKIGFIKHLLGLGDTSTVDAVELNFWLTGKGSTRQQEGKRETLVRNLKEYGIKNPAISKLVTDRIGAQVTRLAKQYDLDPAVASHIMHHWLWDAAKEAQTTHKGMMEAQARFMPESSPEAPRQRPDPRSAARARIEQRGAGFANWTQGTQVVENPEQHEFKTGEPVTVIGHHGSAVPITAFDVNKAQGMADPQERGIYFLTTKEMPERYAKMASQMGRGKEPTVTSAYLRMENPFVGPRRSFKQLRAEGYDAWIGVPRKDSPEKGVEIAVFNGNQIKSATDNSGAFDQKNPDIRFMPEASDIERANRTARAAGAVGAKAITPRYVADTLKPGETVLNFGAGKPDASGKYGHSETIRAAGGIVTEHDFGRNAATAAQNALAKKYDTVFASNVLNVQSGLKMLTETLEQIKGSARKRAVFNFPESPRYSDLTTEDVAAAIKDVFGAQPRKVGGTNRAPLWEVAITTTAPRNAPNAQEAARRRMAARTQPQAQKREMAPAN